MRGWLWCTPSSVHNACFALLCSESVATLRRFVDVRSLPAWGGVSHALAAGLRQLLADWALFLAQLEHRALRGSLSLQVRRWFQYTIIFLDCERKLEIGRLVADPDAARAPRPARQTVAAGV